jgi:hypothetical protein
MPLPFALRRTGRAKFLAFAQRCRTPGVTGAIGVSRRFPALPRIVGGCTLWIDGSDFDKQAVV